MDRHLLGLKLAALENGYDVPELYLDTSFKESTYYKLSTSQVGFDFYVKNTFLCIMGYYMHKGCACVCACTPVYMRVHGR